MLGHDHAHSGRSEYKAGANSGAVKWKFQPHSNEHRFSTPAIGVNGIIYLGFRDDSLTAYLYAMTPNGKIEWRFSDAGSGRVSWRPAIAADGTVFVSGDNLLAVNPNGTLKWKYEHSAGSPVIGADGTVYATCGPNVELSAFGGPGH